jgi:hypothetical protein
VHENENRKCRGIQRKYYYIFVMDPRRKLKLKATSYWSSDFPDAAAIAALRDETYNI